MVRRFLRQRFGSPGMSIALALIALLTAVLIPLAGPEGALGTGFLATILIAAGSVSRDASGGALQMILARPIRRTSYLFGRYLGTLTAFALFLLATAGLGLLFAAILPRMFGASMHADLSVVSLGRAMAVAFLNAAFFAAILLFFSTFLRGYADVLTYIVVAVLFGMLSHTAEALKIQWLQRGTEVLRENALPEVNWSDVLRGHNVLGEATGRWVLALTAYLILAAVIFSRREFTYAHD